MSKPTWREGEHVEVEYYAGLKKLRVLKSDRDNLYTVQLEPLPSGLHVIHSVTRFGGKEEISARNPILFQTQK